MNKSKRVPIVLQIPASVCRICPLCIAMRRWPHSGYAKVLSKVAKICPFCMAYRKVMQIAARGESAQDQPAEADDGAGPA